MTLTTTHVSRRNLGQRLFRGFNDGGRDLVGVCIGRRSAIFQAALPAVNNGGYRDSNARAAVRNTIAELIDRLRFMLARQSLLVMSAIDTHMTLNVLAEVFTDFCEN